MQLGRILAQLIGAEPPAPAFVVLGAAPSVASVLRRITEAVLAGALLVTPTAAITEAAGPPAVLEIALDAEAGLTLSGRLPAGLGVAQLREAIPELRIAAETETDGDGAPQRFLAAVEALNVALPRIKYARIRIAGDRVTMVGRLQDGVSRKETRAALRSALGPDWQLDFELDEVPPKAAVRFSHDAGGTQISGILPAGLTAGEAIATLGGEAEATLTTGGTGEASSWSRALTGVGRLLKLFHYAEGSVAETAVEIEGGLRPGHAEADIRAFAENVLGPGWTLTLSGRETPAEEGAVRLNPVTREAERLVDGYWVLEAGFEPDPAACASAMARVQVTDKLTFEAYAEKLGRDASGVLDRLAGIARHCLSDRQLALEIGGHTDKSGDPAANMALSERRAEAVRQALADRGVPRSRMRAEGYGSARPIADNGTEDGRSANRRITFDWVLR
ncbi:MAG: OmpA family protein [Paracoccaceae bacterium]